nr:hypothetical transcript [Hymenolepis microstoma]
MNWNNHASRSSDQGFSNEGTWSPSSTRPTQPTPQNGHPFNHTQANQSLPPFLLSNYYEVCSRIHQLLSLLPISVGTNTVGEVGTSDDSMSVPLAPSDSSQTFTNITSDEVRTDEPPPAQTLLTLPAPHPNTPYYSIDNILRADFGRRTLMQVEDTSNQTNQLEVQENATSHSSQRVFVKSSTFPCPLHENTHEEESSNATVPTPGPSDNVSTEHSPPPPGPISLRCHLNLSGGGEQASSSHGECSTQTLTDQRNTQHVNKLNRKYTPREAAAPLEKWFDEHRSNPYPTVEDKCRLAEGSGMSCYRPEIFDSSHQQTLFYRLSAKFNGFDFTTSHVDEGNEEREQFGINEEFI